MDLLQFTGKIPLWVLFCVSIQLDKTTIMKNLFLVCLAGILTHTLSAQFEGPLSGGSFTNTAIVGSNKSWTNTSNAGASDNSYASFGNLGGGVGSHTDYLVATNFNFAIPSGVLISGIVVEVERSDPSGRTSDFRVRIVKGGVIGLADRSGGAAYGISDSYQLYGNAGDNWGEGWTPADINSPNFGVAIAAQRSVTGGTTAGRIDDIRITVFYDFSTTLPVRLTSFIASRQDRSVMLKWKTTDESNMSEYLVERSANGRDFTAIQSVASRNNSYATEYAYTDNAPIRGISYYRIKMKGTAGDIRHSPVISIHYSEIASVDLYPTILGQGQMINIRNAVQEKLTIRFISANGQQVARITTNENRFSSILLQNQKGTIYYQVFRENGSIAGNGRLLVQ